MSTHRVAFMLALSLAFITQSARAFIDPPWITPEEPREGEMVSVNIRMGICDAIIFRPGYPQVTQKGNAIHMLEYGNHVTFNDFCIYDIGTTTDLIGPLAPGDYTLMVDFLYENYPFGYATITLGVIPFTVTGAAPVVTVPTFDRWGLTVLLLLVLALAVGAFHMRRRRSLL